jgi:hypothetical protein
MRTIDETRIGENGILNINTLEFEEFEEWDYIDDYSCNMFCDNTGYCLGSSCSNWIKCKG